MADACRGGSLCATTGQVGRAARNCHRGVARWPPPCRRFAAPACHFRFMVHRTLAHLSDLHIGRSDSTDRRAVSLCRALVERQVDHVVVTGDVTHRGRQGELRRFREIFAPLSQQGRLTVVPGNHDWLGDDVSPALRAPQRVSAQRLPGLYLVSFDSTGPHNRSFIAGHGQMSADDVVAIEQTFTAAPAGCLRALLLHHHLLPLPHDNSIERVFSWLGWTSAAELPLGATLVRRLRGMCDVVLHGHRHDPAMTTVSGQGAPPLAIFNAGSSTELGHVRLFAHQQGRLVGPPVWVKGEAGVADRFREHVDARVG